MVLKHNSTDILVKWPPKNNLCDINWTVYEPYLNEKIGICFVIIITTTGHYVIRDTGKGHDI